MNPELESKEHEGWLSSASEKWKNTDLSERQYWLAQVADDLGLNERDKFMLIMKHKAFGFENIPLDRQKDLAKKWGMIDSE